jgi:hypothetical protein
MKIINNQSFLCMLSSLNVFTHFTPGILGHTAGGGEAIHRDQSVILLCDFALYQPLKKGAGKPFSCK